MERNRTLAYLAGVLDGDGYFKIVRSRLQGGRWFYYHIQVGLQQLWPGEAVRLFARTFGGTMMKPMIRDGLRPMARCELHARKAKAAVNRLLPYLLVKRPQALLLRDLSRLKAQPKLDTGFSRPQAPGSEQGVFRRRRFSVSQTEAMERLRCQLNVLHEGSRHGYEIEAGSVESRAEGCLEWTRGETLAYLAGIMDSDGSFRIERRRVKGMLAPQYRISTRAAQVMPSGAIDLLAKAFGGCVRTKKSNRPAHRNLAFWSLHDKSAAIVVSALLPYLVVKKQQAELLLELRRRKAQGKKGLTEWTHRNRGQRPIRMRKRCYTREQVAEFERLRRELNALHAGEIASKSGSRTGGDVQTSTSTGRESAIIGP